ncbi:hypothetical protein CCACVL1_03846 [Corchorus capsularis]|uniref:Uncharacterized protein n=1 Tax=Corchorus capsularis TaxID=210143 RepID=A0A1R3JWV3_COCAP|nr:hypothetical protein CCACVL1_03846 [Corchorus capsularis]
MTKHRARLHRTRLCRFPSVPTKVGSVFGLKNNPSVSSVLEKNRPE